VRTFTPKPNDVERQWYVIDATDVVLGRLASQAAQLLRGKHKAIYAPHVDTGDFVVDRAAKPVEFTGLPERSRTAAAAEPHAGARRRRTP
jgi:large subunit ribosomal protein L13